MRRALVLAVLLLLGHCQSSFVRDGKVKKHLSPEDQAAASGLVNVSSLSRQMARGVEAKVARLNEFKWAVYFNSEEFQNNARLIFNVAREARPWELQKRAPRCIESTVRESDLTEDCWVPFTEESLTLEEEAMIEEGRKMELTARLDQIQESRKLSTSPFSVSVLSLELWQLKSHEFASLLLAWMYALSGRRGRFVASLTKLRGMLVKGDQFADLDQELIDANLLDDPTSNTPLATTKIAWGGKSVHRKTLSKLLGRRKGSVAEHKDVETLSDLEAPSAVEERIGSVEDTAGLAEDNSVGIYDVLDTSNELATGSSLSGQSMQKLMETLGTGFTGLATGFFLCRALLIEQPVADRALLAVQGGLVWADVFIHVLLAGASGGITVPISMAAGMYSVARGGTKLASLASQKLRTPATEKDIDEIIHRRTEVCFASLYAAAGSAENVARLVNGLDQLEGGEEEMQRIFTFDGKKDISARRKDIGVLFTDLFNHLLTDTDTTVHNLNQHLRPVESERALMGDLLNPSELDYIWDEFGFSKLGKRSKITRAQFAEISVMEARAVVVSKSRFSTVRQRDREAPVRLRTAVGMLGRVPLTLCGEYVRTVGGVSPDRRGKSQYNKYILPENMDWNDALANVNPQNYQQCREQMRADFPDTLVADRMPCSPREYIAAFFYNVRKQSEHWQPEEKLIAGFDTLMSAISSPTVTMVDVGRDMYVRAINRERTLSGKLFSTRDTGLLMAWHTLNLYHTLSSPFFRRTSSIDQLTVDVEHIPITNAEFFEAERHFGFVPLSQSMDEEYDENGQVSRVLATSNRPRANLILVDVDRNYFGVGEDSEFEGPDVRVVGKHEPRMAGRPDELMPQPDPETQAAWSRTYSMVQMLKASEMLRQQKREEAAVFTHVFKRRLGWTTAMEYSPDTRGVWDLYDEHHKDDDAP